MKFNQRVGLVLILAIVVSGVLGREGGSTAWILIGTVFTSIGMTLFLSGGEPHEQETQILPIHL